MWHRLVVLGVGPSLSRAVGASHPACAGPALALGCALVCPAASLLGRSCLPSLVFVVARVRGNVVLALAQGTRKDLCRESLSSVQSLGLSCCQQDSGK